jgi:fermentation-respiration switch protein FrsA (DUF1100 family)
VSPGFIIFLIIAVLVYGLFCVALFLRQDGYLYFPEKRVTITPAMFDIPFDDVRFTTEDGVNIAAWYVPGKSATRDTPTVLFCHGNAGNIGDRATCVQAIHEMGLHVLIFDYRGYGDSEGTPTEVGTYADAEAAWHYLTATRGANPNNIIIYGRSLGGGIASKLALNHVPRVLLLESTFTSIVAMAKRMFPLLPVQALVRYSYNTAGRLPHIDCPVYLAHSPEDKTVPFAMGRSLFAAAKEPKQFHTLSGPHNVGGLDIDLDYRASFLEFLTKNPPQLTPVDCHVNK